MEGSDYFRLKKLSRLYVFRGLVKRSKRPKQVRTSHMLQAHIELIFNLRKDNPTYGKANLTVIIKIEFQYQAGSWKRECKVVGKAGITNLGENPRFIVANLEGSPEELYDKVYCQRGNMENRIKEQQLELFADRTSCHKWWPNQLGLLFSSLAYTLIDYISDNLLQGTELATAQVGTIRLKLFKIGAAIIRNIRSIRFLLSSAYPYQHNGIT